MKGRVMDGSKRTWRSEYRLRDFLFYTCLLAVPVVTAVAAILRHSALWAVVFLLFSAGVAVLLLKFFCTRCPHYTRQGKTLRCIFFWGFPKLFAPRAGGYDNLDLAVSGLAAVAFALFPLWWLAREPLLLVVYALSLAGFGAAIYRNECEQCIHLECPANRAEETIGTDADFPVS
jgi:hypothetical protein